MIIRREKPEDIDAIYQVNARAFDSNAESELINDLRKRNMVTLSLIAVQDGRILGHILFSPVAIESERSSFGAITLAPMAVLPKYQRKGIGCQVVAAGLAE